MNSVETDTADPQEANPPSEQTPMPAAALTISTQSSYPAQHELSKWTEILADNVCSEHCSSGVPIRPASRVVLRTADGVKVVTDHVKRVRLRTEKGEKVMIDFRSANVTHPILSVSGMSTRGIQVVLGHKYGYRQRGSQRLDLTCRGDLYFLRAKMENDDVHDCALVMRDEDGDVEEAPEDAGVDDEREDAMATEMRGPDEPTMP